MLPTFVIGLREGVEASLIVGIVAAFLRQQGRSDALRRVWAGVALAVAVCLAVAIGLQVVDENLPQRQQEMLETVVALLAVGMVSYMVVFMRRHARHMRHDLEGRAGSALAAGSATALVFMAFLAVMREGLETAVFLLAAFQASTSRAAASTGAALGIAVAVVLGYFIYRGGVRINLARFFTATGLVLVLVAAGLVSFAAHTAHEAGWLTSLQGQALDLSSVVRPGTVASALVTGVLGIQARPTHAEVIGWLCYLVPAALFVLWPQGRRVAPRRRSTAIATLAVVSLVLVVALAACGSSTKSAGGNASATPNAHTLDVKLTDNGCEPRALQVASGATTFRVTNGGSAAVTEFEVMQGAKILGEVENVTPGIDRSFSLTLAPGTYTTNCSGGKQAKGTLTVEGPGADAATVPTTA